MSGTTTLTLAEEWVADWNRHDLDAILSHYAEDAVLTSPLVVARLKLADGTVHGHAALRHYFTIGLRSCPALRFTLTSVLIGVEGAALCYDREDGRQVVEIMTTTAQETIATATIFYSRPEATAAHSHHAEAI